MKPLPIDDLRGASKLTADAVVGVADLAENLHRTVTRLAPPLGDATTEPMRGITGFVYRRVRGTTRLVERGIDAALDLLPLPGSGGSPSPRHNRMQAVLNGIVGDHLAVTGNPLAIPMTLRQEGEALAFDRDALAQRFGPSDDRLLVLVHGLCMDDNGWNRDGHNHGTALARDLGYTPLYLRYNSGCAIADNGWAFADLLERVLNAWPAPVRDLTLVGHSMGGLVIRSAFHYARRRERAWLRRLSRTVFLGTPHHGAPLERTGHAVDRLLGTSPYTAPFTRLGLIRSQGIQDLRHGRYLDATEHAHDLPEHADCFALAATQARPLSDVLGDGLVPVRSALGHHPDADQSLPIPESHRRIVHGVNHFDLLSDPAVYIQLRRWLG